MQDGFKRTIDYMRISVTDRCNLRCLYCMPADGIPWLPKADILTYEEIALFVRAAATQGISRIRITGGEPLIRPDLASLVERIVAIPGIHDVSLSTNALGLAEKAEDLARAGIRRINISLDTLRPDRFRSMTRRDRFREVWEGIEAADRAGMKPLKINAVAMKGINDDEIEDLARLSVERDWHVRFIEMMPLEQNVVFQPQAFLSADEVLERLKTIGGLEPDSGPDGNGPARYYRLPGAKGTIGVISPLSHNYCESCNRVRLTATGQLRLCLYGDMEIDVRSRIRAGATVAELGELIQRSMFLKPERHNLEVGKTASALKSLAQTGG